MTHPFLISNLIGPLPVGNPTSVQDGGLLGWVIGLGLTLTLALIVTNREDPTGRS